MKQSIFPIEVGAQVFMEPGGNAARRHSEELLVGTVSKIGRKYFYVDVVQSYQTLKFERESFCSQCEDCNSSYTLWPTDESYRENRRIRGLLVEVREVFGSYHQCKYLSAAAIEAIYEVLTKDGLTRTSAAEQEE